MRCYLKGEFTKVLNKMVSVEENQGVSRSREHLSPRRPLGGISSNQDAIESMQTILVFLLQVFYLPAKSAASSHPSIYLIPSQGRHIRLTQVDTQNLKSKRSIRASSLRVQDARLKVAVAEVQGDARMLKSESK
jgi:hypothetical protein